MNRTQSSTTALLIVSFMLMGSLLHTLAIAQDKSVDWHPFEEAIHNAEENQQFILIDVWAPWCGWCKKMEKEVYPNLPANLSNQFVWTRLNRDDNESDLQFSDQTFTPLRLTQKMNVQSVPALVFLSPEGEYLFHTSGFIDIENLKSVLARFASKVNQPNSIESIIVKNQ